MEWFSSKASQVWRFLWGKGFNCEYNLFTQCIFWDMLLNAYKLRVLTCSFWTDTLVIINYLSVSIKTFCFKVSFSHINTALIVFLGLGFIFSFLLSHLYMCPENSIQLLIVLQPFGQYLSNISTDIFGVTLLPR